MDFDIGPIAFLISIFVKTYARYMRKFVVICYFLLQQNVYNFRACTHLLSARDV